ncbi:MAG: hypothetical protein DRP79_04460 [Planctomycetota bacterium]|nr:MAG: hypothetical protein DRP79_04460 [Planctomycetota bacterium]
MRYLKTFIVTAACVAFVLGGRAYAVSCRACAEKGQRDGMKLLEEAHELMRELSETHLPMGDVGPGVQNDQRRIIRNLDDLVRMILDRGAETYQDPRDGENRKNDGSSGQTNPDNGAPGGPDPAPVRGAPSEGEGGKSGDDATAPPTGHGKAWSPLLPDREYKDTRMPKDTKTVPAYRELLRRFRETVAREAARLNDKR